MLRGKDHFKEESDMAIVKVGNIEIGAGIPKVCVAIVGKTQEEILSAAREIMETTANLVEWRVDWFEEIFDFDKVRETLLMLREIMEDRPILFTCRTSKEGGEISLTEQQYKILNQVAIESEAIDLVDVEMFGYGKVSEELIRFAHENNVKVVGSNHDFDSTPSQEEIVRRLVFMQENGADIPKIAVMPQDAKDVLTLLAATEEMTREHDKTPVITMSMGAKGVISRVSGLLFGSAVTFAAVGKTSAPGQLEVEEVRKIMRILR